jgi:hypothetical protein
MLWWATKSDSKKKEINNFGCTPNSYTWVQFHGVVTYVHMFKFILLVTNQLHRITLLSILQEYQQMSTNHSRTSEITCTFIQVVSHPTLDLIKTCDFPHPFGHGCYCSSQHTNAAPNSTIIGRGAAPHLPSDFWLCFNEWLHEVF